MLTGWERERSTHRERALPSFQTKGFICQNSYWAGALENLGLPAFHSTLPAAQLESLARSCRQKVGTRPPELFQRPQLSPCQASEPLSGKQGNCHAQSKTQLRALHQLSAGSLDQIAMTGTILYLYKGEFSSFGWFSVPFFIWVPLKFHLNSEFPWYISAHFWD